MESVAEASVAKAPRIELHGLSKRFVRQSGEVTHAVRDIDLEVQPGEFLVLLGPSGCGKTTLLRLIAGLETPDDGVIRINGALLHDRAQKVAVPPERRPISMVFQSYGLWPHMTVWENIAYPLKARRTPKADIRTRVAQAIAAAGIGGLEQQYPTQLSGGQQQRVALARAVVSANDVVLFDEPLSNVDAKVRDQLRVEILRMQAQLGFTAVYVTHDQDEAMMLGDRIVVLDQGRIAQLGSPRDVYEDPSSPYVARFVGTVDETRAKVLRADPGAGIIEVETGSGRTVTVRSARASGSLGAPGTEAILMTRPERWRIHHEPVAGGNVLPGTVQAAHYLAGSRTECLVETAEGLVRVWASHRAAAAEGDAVWLTVEPADVLIFGADE